MKQAAPFASLGSISSGHMLLRWKRSLSLCACLAFFLHSVFLPPVLKHDIHFPTTILIALNYSFGGLGGVVEGKEG